MAKLTEVAAAIEQRTTAKLARSSVVLELPLYDGQYAGRFGLLPEETQAEFEALGERAQRGDDISTGEAITAAADLIGQACRQVLGRSEPGGPYEALEHDDGRPVRLDEDFAKLLELERGDGKPIEDAGGVVVACFTVQGDDGELEVNTAALQGFAIRLLTFMQDTRAPVEGEVVGEAVGGRK